MVSEGTPDDASSQAAPRIVATGAGELRALFNAEILPQAARGELLVHVASSAPTSPHSGQPPGTVTEELEYFDGRQLVARAIRFVMPDGSIGASGRPDPKAILWQSELLVIEIR